MNDNEMEYISAFTAKAHDFLHNGTGAGNDYLGWLNLPSGYDRLEVERVKRSAEKIRGDSKALVVIGVGGSSAGSMAAIDLLAHPFYNQRDKGPAIYFAGRNLSAPYLAGLFDILENKDISVNVISKSGTTTEPALAFRIFREYMERRYGKAEAAKRIYVTTDRTTGLLRKIADASGFTTFTIPSDIGGRFSVLTSVGLLPMAVCGINIDDVLAGANDSAERYNDLSFTENDCYSYAAIRNILYRKGRTIEILANFDPSLHGMCEWWKQLFGESEGKDGKGIFPASVDFTADLHSLGQYIQDGMRNIFETVLSIEKSGANIKLGYMENDPDKLNYLAGTTYDQINKKAAEATIMAHSDGGVPVMRISIEAANAYNFGGLVYFFEKACAISGYLMGVNPFDQPGVEAYKKNMFTLLGKRGD
jgi:glucose-6-phosphate isomerase